MRPDQLRDAQNFKRVSHTGGGGGGANGAKNELLNVLVTSANGRTAQARRSEGGATLQRTQREQEDAASA